MIFIKKWLKNKRTINATSSNFTITPHKIDFCQYMNVKHNSLQTTITLSLCKEFHNFFHVQIKHLQIPKHIIQLIAKIPKDTNLRAKQTFSNTKCTTQRTTQQMFHIKYIVTSKTLLFNNKYPNTTNYTQ